MEAITTLLTQYSGVEIFIILLLVAVSVKFISELFDWFHARLKAKYDDEEDQKDKYDDVLEEIKSLREAMSELSTQLATDNGSLRADMDEVKKSLHSIDQRLMDTIRSSIIDKHHKYMESGQITDFALSSLERQYGYYKDAGGNTFVDRLMTDVRGLPVVDSDEAIGEEK